MTDPAPYIVTAVFLGGFIGALGTWLYYRVRLERKEKETWRAAMIYYTHRNQEG